MHFFAWNQLKNIYDSWVMIDNSENNTLHFFQNETKMEVDTCSPTLSICTADAYLTRVAAIRGIDTVPT